MSLVSREFFIFIPLLFAVYFLAYKLFSKFQWIVLLVASYVFYLFAAPKFALFLLFSTVTTWFFPLLIDSQTKRFNLEIAKAKESGSLTRDEKKVLQKNSDFVKKRWVAICLLLNIGLLFFLKYTNFLIGCFQNIAPQLQPLNWLILPLGLSFYTFQAAGYCIDVYRGIAQAEHNFFRYALYVSFFPQISQGPIGRYTDLAPQLRKPHQFQYDEFILGLERIVLGYFKKVVVANTIGTFVGHIYDTALTKSSGAVLLFATGLYGIQLYADFSGYMDIILGVSQCLGIKLAENFQTPYFSKSIAEFWRRWHISLSSWFKDYLYYPILRSSLIMKMSRSFLRKGHKKLFRILPTVLALLVTWTIVGLWHGAAWKFVAYGLYHGFFIILAVLLSNVYIKLKKTCRIKEESAAWKGFQIIRTFSIVTLGYVIFRSDGIRLALSIYKAIFTRFTFSGFRSAVVTTQFGRAYWIIVLFGLLSCFVIELLEVKKPFAKWVNSFPLPVRWVILYVMMSAVLLSLLNQPADAGNFIYFKF